MVQAPRHMDRILIHMIGSLYYGSGIAPCNSLRLASRRKASATFPAYPRPSVFRFPDLLRPPRGGWRARTPSSASSQRCPAAASPPTSSRGTESFRLDRSDLSPPCPLPSVFRRPDAASATRSPASSVCGGSSSGNGAATGTPDRPTVATRDAMAAAHERYPWFISPPARRVGGRPRPGGTPAPLDERVRPTFPSE